MDYEIIFLLIIIIPTLIVMLLQKILKNKKNKFSNFINKLWNEYFEEQHYAIVVSIYAFAIIFVLYIIFR